MIEKNYEILGLNINASVDDVKKRYSQLAKIYYPDMNSGDKEKEEKFRKITYAYRTLIFYMQDRCFKYHKISECCSNELNSFSDEKILEFIKLFENNINELDEEIVNINKINLKMLTDADIYDLQSRIITIKYKKSLEQLASKKNIEKFQKWFLYYFIPSWRKNFDEKYLNEENKSKDYWKEKIDEIVEQIYLKKIQIRKNWDDIDQMNRIRKDLCNKKNNLNKELIKRKRKNSA